MAEAFVAARAGKEENPATLHLRIPPRESGKGPGFTQRFVRSRERKRVKPARAESVSVKFPTFSCGIGHSTVDTPIADSKVRREGEGRVE
ncbi:MAG TPA: hypothetical protein VIU34_34400 [Steroidobacter sp.]